MNTSSTGPTRATWMVLAGGLVSAVCIYPVVIAVIHSGAPAPPPGARPAPTLWLPFAVASLLALMFSMNWTRRQLPYPDAAELDTPLMKPAEFMTASIVGMATAEAASVIGFVWCILSHGSWRDYLPFGAGSLLVLLLVSIPRGQAYWSAWEAASASQPPTA